MQSVFAPRTGHVAWLLLLALRMPITSKMLAIVMMGQGVYSNVAASIRFQINKAQGTNIGGITRLRSIQSTIMPISTSIGPKLKRLSQSALPAALILLRSSSHN